MAKVEIEKVTSDKGAATGGSTAKEVLKRSVAAAKPQKSNMTAYVAIAIAGCLGLYFFSGPTVPEPDRSGLVEADGVVTQALPASVTGVSEDMKTDSLELEPEDGAPQTDSVAAAGPAPVVSADPYSAEAAVQVLEATHLPTAAGSTGAEHGLPPVPAVAPASVPGLGETGVAPPPPSSATTGDKLAGTSAAGATLPAMFAAAAPGEAPAKAGLMMPAEMATSTEVPKFEEKPAEEVSLQERADRGDADAMFQLGMTAVSNDDSEGLKKRFRYLQAAATRGSVPAMREVAGLHERGEGVLASERMAYVWATLASAFGEDMSSFRDRLAAKMSDDELESGQRAAAATLKGLGSAAMEKAKAYKMVAKS